MYLHIIEITLIILSLQLALLTLVSTGTSKISLIMILISIEIIILALAIFSTNLAFILDDLIGVYLALILLPIAGGESAIGLMITLQYYPQRGTIYHHSP